jgi:RNA polymerase sigma-70 factor (ECF subfamily)
LYSHFVTNYNKDIFQLAFQLTKDRELSEDLTQDVFIKGFQKIQSFQQKSQFSTWLYRIAYNLIINELRKRKMSFSSFHDEEDSYEDLAEIDAFFDDNDDTEQRYQQLDAALQQLTKDEYAFIHFYYYENKTIDEIAFITAQTSANVKVKLFRIRKKLYNIMRYERE